MFLNPEKVRQTYHVLLEKELGITAHPLGIEKFQIFKVVAYICSFSLNFLSLTNVVWLGRYDYFKKLPFFMHHTLCLHVHIHTRTYMLSLYGHSQIIHFTELRTKYEIL